ncbi:MAG: SAM-dependent methyltransferase [Syntrophorhabdaceae bacterium]|nr:SAM-dependent methyltransferase [Syntrophorhabdaceae bacterium]
MNYKINTTHKYHKEYINTLGWELTICNSLYPENTILRKILVKDESFGKLLYKHLNQYIPVYEVEKIVEIGGGYGYLMKDFLNINSSLKPTMIDISPFLLQKQKETLKDFRVTFVESDFLQMDDKVLTGYDLAIMNENLADFPTIVNLKKDIFKLPKEGIDDPIVKKIRDFFERYNFDIPDNDIFNFNLGAIEATEKLCRAGIPCIYIGEHSCEANPPEHLKKLIKFKPEGNPERIPLMGHDEYTIKFSYLNKIGNSFRYEIIRGVFADFIRFKCDERIEYILLTRGKYSDEDEMVYQFVEDLFKYEYLIFIKPDRWNRTY